eukprot:TRINITY_DN5051_c0_g1_i1.p1 TRINITY_DN5051_c0_g1~~TRINITY_DN5051_c0_g1_i1.p1  ORF type:complete len:1043 (+),score=298.04 TRINITY_DN5051_c0_g1_i1:187-3129(+)
MTSAVSSPAPEVAPSKTLVIKKAPAVSREALMNWAGQVWTWRTRNPAYTGQMEDWDRREGRSEAEIEAKKWTAVSKQFECVKAFQLSPGGSHNSSRRSARIHAFVQMESVEAAKHIMACYQQHKMARMAGDCGPSPFSFGGIECDLEYSCHDEIRTPSATPGRSPEDSPCPSICSSKTPTPKGRHAGRHQDAAALAAAAVCTPAPQLEQPCWSSHATPEPQDGTPYRGQWSQQGDGQRAGTCSPALTPTGSQLQPLLQGGAWTRSPVPWSHDEDDLPICSTTGSVKGSDEREILVLLAVLKDLPKEGPRPGMDELFWVFSQFGVVEKMSAFVNEGNNQVLVQYETTDQKLLAMKNLNGRRMEFPFVGEDGRRYGVAWSCQWAMTDSVLHKLTFQQNDARNACYGPFNRELAEALPVDPVSLNGKIGKYQSILDFFWGQHVRGEGWLLPPQEEYLRGRILPPEHIPEGGDGFVIHISGLSEVVTPHMLFAICGIYGPVVAAKLLFKRDSKGSAIVQFRTIAAAARAIEYLDGINCLGRPWRVQKSTCKNATHWYRAGTELEDKMCTFLEPTCPQPPTPPDSHLGKLATSALYMWDVPACLPLGVLQQAVAALVAHFRGRPSQRPPPSGGAEGGGCGEILLGSPDDVLYACAFLNGANCTISPHGPGSVRRGQWSGGLQVTLRRPGVKYEDTVVISAEGPAEMRDALQHGVGFTLKMHPGGRCPPRRPSKTDRGLHVQQSGQWVPRANHRTAPPTPSPPSQWGPQGTSHHGVQQPDGPHQQHAAQQWGSEQQPWYQVQALQHQQQHQLQQQLQQSLVQAATQQLQAMCAATGYQQGQPAACNAGTYYGAHTGVPQPQHTYHDPYAQYQTYPNMYSQQQAPEQHRGHYAAGASGTTDPTQSFGAPSGSSFSTDGPPPMQYQPQDSSGFVSGGNSTAGADGQWTPGPTPQQTPVHGATHAALPPPVRESEGQHWEQQHTGQHYG